MYIVKVLEGDGKKGNKVHKIRTSKRFTTKMLCQSYTVLRCNVI